MFAQGDYCADFLFPDFGYLGTSTTRHLLTVEEWLCSTFFYHILPVVENYILPFLRQIQQLGGKS